MKAMFAALVLVSGISTTTFAADCVTADGVTIADGTSARLFYSANPKKEVGPSYSCGEMSRVRACVNGELSKNIPECSQYDSGGCVDYWVDRLPDTDFPLATCND